MKSFGYLARNHLTNLNLQMKKRLGLSSFPSSKTTEFLAFHSDQRTTPGIKPHITDFGLKSDQEHNKEAGSLAPLSANVNGINDSTIEDIWVHVGLIIDTQSWVGKIVYSCISMAITDFYGQNSHYRMKLVLHTRDSEGDPLLLLSHALVLLESVKLDAIIVAENSVGLKILAELGSRVKIPVISLYNDSARQILSNVIASFEATSVRLALHVTLLASSTGEEIIEQLKKLMSLQTSVYVVHMSAVLASRLFLNAERLGMISQGYAWIITDVITNFMNSMDANFMNSMDASVSKSMQGVVGFKPHIPASKELREFAARATAAESVITRHPNIVRQETRLNMNFTIIHTSQNGLMFIDEISQSRFKGISGCFQLTSCRLIPKEFKILNLFECYLAGRNYEHSKRLESTWQELRIGAPVNHGFSELINVIRDPQTKETTVNGFCVYVFKEAIKSLDYEVHYEFIPFVDAKGQPAGTHYDLILQNYDVVVGDLTIFFGFSHVNFTMPYTDLGIGIVVPKSNKSSLWIFLQPLTGRGIRVGGDITISPNLEEGSARSVLLLIPEPFMSSKRGEAGQGILCTFCCVVGWQLSVPVFLNPRRYWRGWQGFGYRMIFEFEEQTFIAMMNEARERRAKLNAGSLNLPIEIRAEKALDAIFVCCFGRDPIEEEDKSLLNIMLRTVFPTVEQSTIQKLIKDKTIKVAEGGDDADIVPELKPLSKEAFLRTALGWLEIGGVFFEEKLLSNLSKFVVIIWVFSVLVITSSYTATLASMLTVQRIQSSLREDYVGSQSLFPDAIRNLKHENSRRMQYQSPEEYDDALRRGSKNGGVSAIIDEIPYLKVFLAKYPADYTMIKSKATAGGFGFVFPKGSPIVQDISGSILRLREEEKLQMMENKWFNNTDSIFTNQDSASNPIRLNLYSFGVCFSLLVCLPLRLYSYAYIRNVEP
ncbi:hypothetical protein F3Y22_tig00006666pilonHSYRG00071 [Hibiscus syriacus]|uniref:Ionotropic glutamate receptor C-terminal domain-containing protein n=1 Tax=Hibiscus syriacus TaxID=106335 RepID=A0A6A3CCM0_HIBSY|nr:hypothetical protein F3Y22_tig00006666pilonHSYRG00071 [Hibiscus syriacus]